MDWFFKLKHWQIFLFVGFILFIPLLSEFLVIFNEDDLFSIRLWTMPIWTLSYIGYILFFGLYLSKIAGKEKGASYYVFIALLSYSLFYSLILKFFLLGEPTEILNKPKNSLLNFSFQLLSMISTLIAIRYNAKLLKSLEKGTEAKGSDYLEEFFQFWFLPIGIWSIHPRAIKIYQSLSTGNKANR